MRTSQQPSDSKFKLGTASAIELDLFNAYTRFTDTENLEQKARATGADVVRTSGEGVEAASSWDIRTKFRKKEREIKLTVLDSRRLEYVTTEFRSAMFEGQANLKFNPKSQELTQVRLDLRLSPKTLSARLVLQGLRLTRRREKRRLTNGLQRLCRYFEAQHAAKG